MAKARKVSKLNSNTKRNLFIVAIVFITLGMLSFFIEYKNQKEAEMRNFQLENQDDAPQVPRDIGPHHGCEERGPGYICNVQINNPSEEELEWSAIIEGIDGAVVSQNNEGTVAPNSSIIVQLIVPQAFCVRNPTAKGKVKILDAKRSSNQSEAEFDCTSDKI